MPVREVLLLGAVYTSLTFGTDPFFDKLYNTYSEGILMKMHILLTLVAVLSLALVACGPANTQQITDEPVVEDILEQLPEGFEIEDVDPITVEIEDGEVTLSIEDGVHIADVDLDEPIAVTDMPMSEYCIPGDTYSFDTENGDSSDTVIQGIETFKGKEYCKGINVTTVQGMEVTTTYYFDQSIREMWVLTEVMGMVTESFIEY